jgi:hypothetical protein
MVVKQEVTKDGFSHPLERRRPRHPHPEGSQDGVREAAMNTALRVVRPRTPIDVSDKAGGGIGHALNAGS